jgi:hypothetical protein
MLTKIKKTTSVRHILEIRVRSIQQAEQDMCTPPRVRSVRRMYIRFMRKSYSGQAERQTRMCYVRRSAQAEVWVRAIKPYQRWQPAAFPNATYADKDCSMDRSPVDAAPRPHRGCRSVSVSPNHPMVLPCML